jgi:hypothetical protein
MLRLFKITFFISITRNNKTVSHANIVKADKKIPIFCWAI